MGYNNVFIYPSVGFIIAYIEYRKTKGDFQVLRRLYIYILLRCSFLLEKVVPLMGGGNKPVYIYVWYEGWAVFCGP